MTDPLIGVQLGHFKIEELIAEGGMGVIYRAAHTVIGKQAAIKILSEKYSSDHNMIKRLHREARAVNRIGHPNIIDIFDFGQTPDHREYFVMEFVPGKSLAQILAERERVPWAFIVPLMSQTLDALAAIHDLGFVHRDIKPENILVTEEEDGRIWIKLLDFGIARSVGLGPDGERLTRAGSVMGTPEYVAPEQIRGREVDGRSDLYAVGVMIYEMVIGRRPYESDKIITILMSHLKDPVPLMESFPPELGIPSHVPEVVQRAMAKNPDDRFRDARVFADALGIELTTGGPPSGIHPALTKEQIAQIRESYHASLATAETASVTPTMTGGQRFSRAVTVPGPVIPEAFPGAPVRPASPLRWILPLLLMAASGIAIGLFFIIKKPAPATAMVPVSNAKSSTPGAHTEIKGQQVDLAALYDQVGRILRKGISSSRPDIRRICVKGVGHLAEQDSLALISSVLRDDPDRTVRTAAAQAIASLNRPAGADALREARARSDATMQVWLDEALMRLGVDEGRENLGQAISSTDKNVRFQAALALGDAGDPAAVPVLEQFAGQAATLDRQTVIAVLGTLAKLGHKQSYESLGKAMKSTDSVLRLGAAEALARLGDERGMNTLTELIQDDDLPTQLVAAKVLASLGDYAGLEALSKAVMGKDESLRLLAAEGLGSIADKAIFPPLASTLQDGSEQVKATAAESLAKVLSQMPTVLVRRSQDWLKTALANRDWSVRHAAVGISSEMDPELAVSLLGWALQDKDPRIRSAAVASLARLRSDKTIPLLAHALAADASEEVRASAAGALGRTGDESAKKNLREAVQDKSPTVRAAAAGSLLALGDDSFLPDLKTGAKSRDPSIRRASIMALARSRDPEAQSMVGAAMNDKSPQVRFAAALQVARRGKQNDTAVAILRGVIGKGGEKERQALQALGAMGLTPTREIQRMGRAKATEARRNSMESAILMKEAQALALLRKGVKDPDHTVRLAAADSLAKLALKKVKGAAPLLQVLAKDPDPAVRSRAALGLAALAKQRRAPDMGTVRPVAPAPLPALPAKEEKRARQGDQERPQPLFVEDTNQLKLYKYHLSQAAVATSRGRFETALRHLRLAQRSSKKPPVLFEFGYVYLKLTLKEMPVSKRRARAHLERARRYFHQYMAKAPDGAQAPRAKQGLRDVNRLMKQLR